MQNISCLVRLKKLPDKNHTYAWTVLKADPKSLNPEALKTLNVKPYSPKAIDPVWDSSEKGSPPPQTRKGHRSLCRLATEAANIFQTLRPLVQCNIARVAASLEGIGFNKGSRV